MNSTLGRLIFLFFITNIPYRNSFPFSKTVFFPKYIYILFPLLPTMSSLEDSCGFMFFRRLFYVTPFMLIGGIVMMFIDVEIGGPLLGVGGIGVIIFILVVLNTRAKNRASARSEIHSTFPLAQSTENFQASQPQYQSSVQEQITVVAAKKNFCSNCGGEINDKMNNCENCGVPL